MDTQTSLAADSPVEPTNLTPDTPTNQILILNGKVFFMNREKLLQSKAWFKCILDKSTPIADGSSTLSMVKTLLGMVKTIRPDDKNGLTYNTLSLGQKLLNNIAIASIEKTLEGLVCSTYDDLNLKAELVEEFATQDNVFLNGSVSLFSPIQERNIFYFLKATNLLDTSFATYFDGQIPAVRDEFGLFDLKMCRSALTLKQRLDVLKGMDISSLIQLFQSDLWNITEDELATLVIELNEQGSEYAPLLHTIRFELLSKKKLLELTDWIYDMDKTIVNLMKEDKVKESSSSRTHGFKLYSKSFMYLSKKGLYVDELRAASILDFDRITECFVSGRVSYVWPSSEIESVCSQGKDWKIMCGDKEINRSFTLTPLGPVFSESSDPVCFSTNSDHVRHRLYVKK